jgi:prevent-host-death family protein
MPTIKSSAELRNNYNQISELCHTSGEPVFITKNGKGDLAIMSVEAYEALTGKLELYRLLKEGLEDVSAGRTKPMDDAFAEIRGRRKQ